MEKKNYKQKYREWERTLRVFIAKAEAQRALAAVEVAKALLLYGMKLYSDLLASQLSEEDRLAFVGEMNRRTNCVLSFCVKNGARAEFEGQALCYPPKEWLDA